MDVTFKPDFTLARARLMWVGNNPEKPFSPPAVGYKASIRSNAVAGLNWEQATWDIKVREVLQVDPGRQMVEVVLQFFSWRAPQDSLKPGLEFELIPAFDPVWRGIIEESWPWER